MIETLKIKKPRDQYKARLLQIKGTLPKDYTQILTSNFPLLDSAKGVSRIRNVMSGRTVDIGIIEALEQINSGTLKLKKAA